MSEELKYLGMAPVKVEGKSFYEGCMSGCEGVHLSNQIKKLTEEKDLLSREFSLSIKLGLMWMDRIEKLEKALEMAVQKVDESQLSIHTSSGQISTQDAEWIANNMLFDLSASIRSLASEVKG